MNAEQKLAELLCLVEEWKNEFDRIIAEEYTPRVNWNKMPTNVKWITGDRFGTYGWTRRPVWRGGVLEYMAKGGDHGIVQIDNKPIHPFLMERPTGGDTNA